MTIQSQTDPLGKPADSGLFFGPISALDDPGQAADNRYPRVSEALYGAWAILPETLRQIEDIYLARLEGKPFDRQAAEDALGRPLDNRQRNYAVQHGSAVIPIEGVIAKRMNLFMAISGGVSTQLLNRDLQAALSDPAVKRIILDIDSPGGSVDGVSELAENVFKARKTKRIYAVADGTTASAAYWIASAADAVYVRNDTSVLGSIGVVALHREFSKFEEKKGVKTTEIVAGRFKRIASQFAPLSEQGRDYIQEQVDYLYSLFVGAVASYRGVSMDAVIEEMADGRLFIGEQAIQAGLADDFQTVEALIERERAARLVTTGGRVTSTAFVTNQRGKPTMTDTAAADQETDLEPVKLSKDDVKTLAPDTAAALRDEGAAQERKRIQDVQDQLMPGHEALIEDMKFDGVTTGPQAAVKVLQAEREKAARRAGEINAEAPKALAGAPSADAGGEGEGEAVEQPSPKAMAAAARELVDGEEQAGRKLSYADAVQRVVDSLQEENDG